MGLGTTYPASSVESVVTCGDELTRMAVGPSVWNVNPDGAGQVRCEIKCLKPSSYSLYQE